LTTDVAATRRRNKNDNKIKKINTKLSSLKEGLINPINYKRKCLATISFHKILVLCTILCHSDGFH